MLRAVTKPTRAKRREENAKRVAKGLPPVAPPPKVREPEPSTAPRSAIRAKDEEEDDAPKGARSSAPPASPSKRKGTHPLLAFVGVIGLAVALYFGLQMAFKPSTSAPAPASTTSPAAP
jgi:hypothetical protein